MASKKQVAVKAPAPGKALALPGSWRERAAKSVAASKVQTAKLPAASGNFLSFRGGSITLAGNQLDNPLPVVILAHGFERTYYSKIFTPDSAAVPDCYSFDGESPHEKSSVPQADRCATCRNNEFGSAMQGPGKACKEGARLVLIHADNLKSPAAVLSATLVQARLSVLNSKTFRSFVEAVDAALWLDVTQLSCVPDKKSQYAVAFRREGITIDEDVLDTLALRADEAEKLLVQPYPEPQETAKPAAAPKRRSKF